MPKRTTAACSPTHARHPQPTPKLLVHDGFGVWCAARRLNAGSFVWPRQPSEAGQTPMVLTQPQFDALVQAIKWRDTNIVANQSRSRWLG